MTEARKLPKLKSGMLNLRGQRFGDLLVLHITSRRYKKHRMWMCRCEAVSEETGVVCNTTLVVRHDYLLHSNNPKTHCGCKNRGLPTLHPREYHIWSSMVRRCYVDTHVGYAQYGGRGIRVCERWLESEYGFKNFFEDMGPRPTPGHSLDRKESNKNYEKDNCRWATGKEQARNKRESVYLPHPETGLKTPAAEVAEFLGVTYQSMRARYIKAGKWPTTPEGIKGDIKIVPIKRAT